MEIEFADFLGNIHIGVSLFSNEKIAFLPNATPNSLTDLIRRTLKVEITKVTESIIGSLVIGNSFGMVVSNVISSEVLSQLKTSNLPIFQAPEFFAFGNVVLANDHGGIISPIVPSSIREKISEILNIPLETKTIANSDLVGSLGFITNHGGIFTPLASEDEIMDFKSILHLKEVGIGSINKGSEFVASGIIGNTKGLLIGRETTGIEIMEISRCFSN
ncbi:MAG: translation initiation factor IF-6 [Candidatus Hodarchaeales archaeon]|jgi:translation initiation factor 6